MATIALDEHMKFKTKNKTKQKQPGGYKTKRDEIMVRIK